MRSRLRPSGFSHSRSFSAPTVPSLKLTPPTPHRIYHEKGYDSDDSIPTSAAAMPHPNKYDRPSLRKRSDPYSIKGQSSPSPTFPPEEFQSVNPGYFRGKLHDETIAASSIVIGPDGRTVTIEGQLVPQPVRYPSQDVQERRLLSQPTSHLIFQNPIDHSVAALGLQNPPNSPTDGETVPPQQPQPPQQPYVTPQPLSTLLLYQEHGAIGVMYHAKYTAYLDQYKAQQALNETQQWMWPIEETPASHP